MKVEMFSKQTSAVHFRSATLIFLRLTRPIRQVHEPTPF